MIDSSYYYQATYEEIGQNVFNPSLVGNSKANFRFFVNGQEISGFHIQFIVSTKKVQVDPSFLSAGDILEIVRILPSFQPYILKSLNDFPDDALYYQTALLRLLMENYTTTFIRTET